VKSLFKGSVQLRQRGDAMVTGLIYRHDINCAQAKTLVSMGLFRQRKYLSLSLFGSEAVFKEKSLVLDLIVSFPPQTQRKKGGGEGFSYCLGTVKNGTTI
jgi:hypothetical protein